MDTRLFPELEMIHFGLCVFFFFMTHPNIRKRNINCNYSRIEKDYLNIFHMSPNALTGPTVSF